MLARILATRQNWGLFVAKLPLPLRIQPFCTCRQLAILPKVNFATYWEYMRRNVFHDLRFLRQNDLFNLR